MFSLGLFSLAINEIRGCSFVWIIIVLSTMIMVRMNGRQSILMKIKARMGVPSSVCVISFPTKPSCSGKISCYFCISKQWLYLSRSLHSDLLVLRWIVAIDIVPSREAWAKLHSSTSTEWKRVWLLCNWWRMFLSSFVALFILYN